MKFPVVEKLKIDYMFKKIMDKNLRRIKKSAWYEKCSILSVDYPPKILKIIGWREDQVYAQRLQTSLIALIKNSEILCL